MNALDNVATAVASFNLAAHEQIATLGAHASTHLATLAAAFNPHVCGYCALGAISLMRAIACRAERRLDEARENTLHAVIYLILGLY